MPLEARMGMSRTFIQLVVGSAMLWWGHRIKAAKLCVIPENAEIQKKSVFSLHSFAAIHAEISGNAFVERRNDHTQMNALVNPMGLISATKERKERREINSQLLITNQGL